MIENILERIRKGITYCEKCGALCDVTPQLIGYSELTGEPRHHLKAKCPNKRWFWDGHKKSKIFQVRLGQLGPYVHYGEWDPVENGG